MANIAERIGVNKNYASQYRACLLERGAIGEHGRGRVGFEPPAFGEFLAEKAGAFVL